MLLLAKCDGLVISGHHTGSFGGKRSLRTLGIDFLEELACKPELLGVISEDTSLMEDERAIFKTLGSIASAIENSKTPILNADELLNRINQHSSSVSVI